MTSESQDNQSPRTLRCVVYLLKGDIDLDAALVRSKRLALKCDLSIPGARRAFLAMTPQRDGVPSWLKMIAGQQLDDIDQNKLDRLFTRSTSAVLLVELDGASFALPFGFGRHLLDTSYVDETFGLRVVLNAVGPNTLKAIDRASLEVSGHRTREQVPRAAAISEFGIDFDQDLVSAVTGRPRDEKLGRTLSGADSLAVSLPVPCSQLAEPLKALKEYADKQDYRATFPWLDKVHEIRNPSLVQGLDTRLLVRLRGGHCEQVWLAPPDVLNWTSAPRFRYKGIGCTELFDDIFLDDFAGAKDLASVTREHLGRWKVEQLDSDDRIQFTWPIYRCLYAEISDETSTYVLNGGRWYQINNDFVGQINTSVKPLLEAAQCAVELPEYVHGEEAEYNKFVAQNDPRFALLDREMIWYGGGQSQIEVCDLMSDTKQLVHVKRYSGSATLSHLFSQGVVSAKALTIDPAFRQSVFDKLPSSHRLFDPQSAFDAREWGVVYAVVTKAAGTIDLPFFSKVTLRNAARDLQVMGYKVAFLPVRDARHLQ